jgi:hypothetical protein
MSVYPRKYRDLIGELSYASSFYYIIGDNWHDQQFLIF